MLRILFAVLVVLVLLVIGTLAYNAGGCRTEGFGSCACDTKCLKGLT